MQNDSRIREYFASLARILCLSPDSLAPAEQRIARALTTGGLPGSSYVPDFAIDLIIDLMSVYGAYATLNVRLTPSGKTRIPTATAAPAAVWLKPGSQGTQITADTAFAGAGATTEANTVASVMDVSRELLQDSAVDLSIALPEHIAQAHAKAIDWACYGADGTDDTTDGGQTGIFEHGSVINVSAGAGNTTVAALQAEDFLAAVDAVAVAAIERGPRWWTHPALYRKLLRVKDASGSLLVDFVDGVPHLLGYPISLTSAAPSTDAAGSKVFAFGCGDAFVVAIRKEFEVQVSEGSKFDYNVAQFRAITRAHCLMGAATWFSVLKTAAA